MACGCGKSKEQRVQEMQARSERIKAAREVKAQQRAAVLEARKQQAA